MGRGSRQPTHSAPSQEELPEVAAAAPTSPIGKAARALLAIRDEIEDTNEVLEKKHAAAKKKLLELLTVEGKEAVTVDGTLFRHIHKDASEEIRILVKKNKKKKDEEI